MIYHIFVLFSIVCFYLYYKEGYRKDIYLKLVFFAMFVIFSIEYYTTQDYSVYYYGFYHASSEHWESLYMFLVKLFNPIGFVAFNGLCSAFEIFTLYFLFRKIVPPKYIWIGVMFFILNTNYLFLYMNVKRQFLAMALIMWVAYFLFYSRSNKTFFSINFVKRKHFYAIICLFSGVMIHSSAYMGLFLFLFFFIKKRISIPFVIVLISIYFASFTFRLSDYMKILNAIIAYTTDSNYYSAYALQQQDYEVEGRIVTFFYQSFDFLLLALLLIYNRKFTNREYPLVLSSIIGLILFNIFFGNFFRLNFYLSMFNVFTIPLLISKIKSKYIRLIFLVFAVAMPVKLYYNAMFTKDKTSYMTAKYKYFYTIFDSKVDKRDMYDMIREK